MTDPIEVIARALGGALFPDVNWVGQVSKISLHIERDGAAQTIDLFPKCDPAKRHGPLWKIVQEHIQPEFEKRLDAAGMWVCPIDDDKGQRAREFNPRSPDALSSSGSPED